MSPTRDTLDPFQCTSGVGGAENIAFGGHVCSFFQETCGSGTDGGKHDSALCVFVVSKVRQNKVVFSLLVPASILYGPVFEEETAMSSSAASCDQFVRHLHKNAGGKGGCSGCTTCANHHRQVLAGLWTARREVDCCCCCCSQTPT